MTPKPMDAARLEEIKARCEKATPGKWESFYLNGSDCRQQWGFSCWINGNHHIIGEMSVSRDQGCTNDITFISHARTDIPDLVAEVERLQKLLKEKENEKA